MPGTGQSPVFAGGGHDGEGAERQWDPVFAWLAGSDLGASRVAVLGLSFGGYWAMELAYTHRDRLAAAVNWGGGVHITFQPDWQARSRNASSYLMGLMTARARMFNGTTFEDYVARCPGLSLLDQGILDRPCAPLLLVNGSTTCRTAPRTSGSASATATRRRPACSPAATWAPARSPKPSPTGSMPGSRRAYARPPARLSVRLAAAARQRARE